VITPAPETIKVTPKVSQVPAPATIIVTLPAEAKLLIDDAATTSTTARRVFVSPTLEPGKEYFYNLKVEFVRDGKTLNAAKKVSVTAGNETTVNFENNEGAVAAR
jgi:uncharacterized protein (TIGR03000 family)